MNTGHDGTLCTLHRNNAVEALWGPRTLVAKAQLSFPSGNIVGAADHVQQLEVRGESLQLPASFPAGSMACWLSSYEGQKPGHSHSGGR
jgi:hypothetical protein